MPKKSTKLKITPEEATLKGIPKTGKYLKVCIYCHKPYYSDARGQRFCSEECRIRYNARRKRLQKRYNAIAPVEKLRVQAHSLGVNTLLMLESLGLVKHECSHCKAQGGDKNVILECHHKDLNFLNNDSTNLEWLCHTCHKKEHSRIEKEVAAKGMVMEEFYPESIRPFIKILNSEKRL